MEIDVALKIEHWKMECKGLRLDSSWGCRIFLFVPHLWQDKTSFFINFIVLLYCFILHHDDVYFHCAASTVVISWDCPQGWWLGWTRQTSYFVVLWGAAETEISRVCWSCWGICQSIVSSENCILVSS